MRFFFFIWINWRRAKYNDSATCTAHSRREKSKTKQPTKIDAHCLLYSFWLALLLNACIRVCCFQFSSFLTTKQIERNPEKRRRRRRRATHIFVLCFFFHFVFSRLFVIDAKKRCTHRGCSSVNFICTVVHSGLKAEFVLQLLLPNSNLIVFFFFYSIFMWDYFVESFEYVCRRRRYWLFFFI